MFNKIEDLIYYDREEYTFAERLYENYIMMRKATTEYEHMKMIITTKILLLVQRKARKNFWQVYM